MPRDRQKIGQCTSCKLGAVNCSHNLFMDGTTGDSLLGTLLL